MPLSEIVVLEVAHKERLGVVTAARRTNDVKTERVLMSHYPS
jgi:hypothetical protein